MDSSKFYDILCKNGESLVKSIETDTRFPMKRNSGEYAIEFILRCLKGSSARAKYYKKWLEDFVKRYLEKRSIRKETEKMGEEDMTSQVSSSAYNKELAEKAKAKAIADAKLRFTEQVAAEKETKMMGQEDKLAKTRDTNLKQATLRKDIATLPLELKQNILGFIDTKLSEKDKTELKGLFTDADYYSELLNLVVYNPMEVKIPKIYQKEAETLQRSEVWELKHLIEKIWLDGTGEELDPDKEGLYYEGIGDMYDMSDMGMVREEDRGDYYKFFRNDFATGMSKTKKGITKLKAKVMAIGKRVLKADLPKAVVKAREKAVKAKEAEIKAVAEKATIPKDAPYGLTKSGKVRTKPLGSNKKEKTGVGIGGGYINY